MSTYPGAWSTLTYATDDALHSVDVWNGRDGVVPQQITIIPGNYPAALVATVFHGEGYTPPGGTAYFSDSPPDPNSGTTLGWPGQPYLVWS